MKSIDLERLENYTGGEVTASEMCGFATGVSVVFIASGFLSLLGAAALMVTTAVACKDM